MLVALIKQCECITVQLISKGNNNLFRTTMHVYSKNALWAFLPSKHWPAGAGGTVPQEELQFFFRFFWPALCNLTGEGVKDEGEREGGGKGRGEREKPGASYKQRSVKAPEEEEAKGQQDHPALPASTLNGQAPFYLHRFVESLTFATAVRFFILTRQ